MFLNLDQKPPQSSTAGMFRKVLPERTLVFIMVTNTWAGSVSKTVSS